MSDLPPRFRSHTRTGKNGQTWTNYYWDGRASQTKDIPLGNDLNLAIERWKQIEGGSYKPPAKPKRVARRLAGKRRKFAVDLWDGVPPWGKRMFLSAETRAASLGRPFVLTVDQLRAAIDRAGGFCEVSGIPFSHAGERHPFSPSVDRIDSKIGYQEGNIRIVCLIANFAMNTWGEEPLYVLAESVWRIRCGTLRKQA